MTNRQAQVGKFSPTRSEQPKFEPNWWKDLPKAHPLADTAPTRQQRRLSLRKAVDVPIVVESKGFLGQRDPNTPNRHERRKMASILRKAARKAAKGKSK